MDYVVYRTFIRLTRSSRRLSLFSDNYTDFGYLTLVSGWEHGILHIARFAVGKEAHLLYVTSVGRSGVIAMLMLVPIVLPMKYNYFRGKVSQK